MKAREKVARALIQVPRYAKSDEADQEWRDHWAEHIVKSLGLNGENVLVPRDVVEEVEAALGFFADGGLYETGSKLQTVPWPLQVRGREALARLRAALEATPEGEE